MTTSTAVAHARFELTLRLSRFIERRATILNSERPHGLLDEVVACCNDLVPLFAAYEASVRAEAHRHLREEVYTSVLDQLDDMMSRASHPERLAELAALQRWAERQRATASKAGMTPASTLAAEAPVVTP